jgi:DnaJ-class molecular chaperone
LGFSKEIEHLNKNKITIYNNHPSRHEDIMVMLKEGMPKIEKDTEEKGDLFVRIIVEHPSEIMNDELKKNLSLLLTGKEKHKIKKDKLVPELIPFDKYKETIKLQNEYSRKYKHEEHEEQDNQPQCKQM